VRTTAENLLRSGDDRVSPLPALSAIRRAWRALRTGVAFAMFGLGVVVISALVLPLLRVASWRRSDMQRRVQLLVHYAFRLFAWFLIVTGLIRVTWHGRERLRARPILVVANHPTLIDVVLLVAAMSQAVCIVKTAAQRRPLFRRIVEGAGYIPNDRPDALIEAGTECLRQGRSLLLFPEGTRSPAGRLGDFRRGAARIALRSGTELVPVVITCVPPTLMKGQRWYDVPTSAAHFTLTVRDPIPVRDHPAAGKPEAAGARELTEALQRFYERSLQANGDGRPVAGQGERLQGARHPG
jgi:1-acyl-sn-glycerol-3-phosphate acyltransferase